MKNPELCYVAVQPKCDSQPLLDAFSQCARKAESVEEFRSLIQSTVAKNEPYQLYADSTKAVEHLNSGGHLFMFSKKAT